MFLYKRPQMKNKRRIGWIWWVGWYDEKGKRHSQNLQSFFGLSFPVTDRQDAKNLLAELQRKEIDERLGFPVDTSSLPIERFYREYLSHSEGNKAKSTVEKDGVRLRKWIAFLKSRGIENISELCERYDRNLSMGKKLLQDFLKEEISKQSNASKNKYVYIVRASFNWGEEQGHVRENPVKSFPRLKEPKQDRTFMFWEKDIEKLFSIEDKPFVAFLKTALYTGCRRSEILNLEWQDIDFKGKKIRLRRTKSGKPEIVPMADDLMPVLKSMSQNGDSVFPLSDNQCTKKFQRLRKRLKLKCIHRIHDLRHLFVRILLDKGVDLKTIQTLTRHKTLWTLLEIYASTSSEKEKKAVDKIVTRT